MDEVFELERDGFRICKGFLTKKEEHIALGSIKSDSSAGVRGVLSIPRISQLAGSDAVLQLLQPFFSDRPFPVRAIFFDKHEKTNWGVPWHQDLTIAVKERVQEAGYGPWSLKNGIVHVQPPDLVLERMLTLRLHLDDTDETNGALKVVPGSHRFGRLNVEQIAILRSGEEVMCKLRKGDALLMRPLLLHSSSKSSDSTSHRRVLHIEYASEPLPGKLRWNDAA